MKKPKATKLHKKGRCELWFTVQGDLTNLLVVAEDGVNHFMFSNGEWGTTSYNPRKDRPPFKLKFAGYL